MLDDDFLNLLEDVLEDLEISQGGDTSDVEEVAPNTQDKRGAQNVSHLTRQLRWLRVVRERLMQKNAIGITSIEEAGNRPSHPMRRVPKRTNRLFSRWTDTHEAIYTKHTCQHARTLRAL
jgi:hypothetical protein